MTGTAAPHAVQPASPLRRLTHAPEPPPGLTRGQHERHRDGQPVDGGVVLEDDGEAEEQTREEGLAPSKHRRGSAATEPDRQHHHRGCDQQPDERLTLRADADAAEARVRRIGQEQVQSRREESRRGRRRQPGRRQRQQPGRETGRNQVRAGNRRLVRPEREHRGIGDMNGRRLLIPRIAVGDVAGENALPDVCVERLVGARGLRQRGQAKREQPGEQQPPDRAKSVGAGRQDRRESYHTSVSPPGTSGVFLQPSGGRLCRLRAAHGGLDVAAAPAAVGRPRAP